KKNTISLSELNKDLTEEEKKIVEIEKKYYPIVVALKKERKERGLTQDRLAQISHVPRTTITKIESGSRNTTLQTLMSIAQAMGKTVELRLS
ncbi:helix-turn-helix transcriptional regulator, partial [Candidatus Microgenomates bacterium]|nr:helix-turn-helix transcriptional regulator [Candidatus Microgenomates bacterium]